MRKWIWLISFLTTGFLTQTSHAAINSFKLYHEPFHATDPSCDQFTQLNLQVDGEKGFAELVPEIAGSCDKNTVGKRRAYALKYEFDDCGSVIYLAHGENQSYAEVTDHRNRLCNDALPATIIVKEADEEGFESTLYSAPKEDQQ